MKINLISPVDPLLTPAQQILINRGMTLEDANHLLNTTDDDIHSYNDLINMDEAVDTFLKHMSKDSGSRVVVQVDADVDGYTSAALIINYVNANYPHIDIDFQVHPQKAHGLIMSEAILQNKYDLVIVPDAGSGEYDKHKELKELNIDCIVLDHHEVDWDSPDAIVVNNQISPQYSNKELSGVGVVWQFCRALDDSGNGEGKTTANDYLDLVALGLQADMMDLRSLETTHLIQKGLKLMNSGITPNPFIRQIIDMQSYSLGPEVTPMGISFYIAPLINAVVRVGTLEERELVFKCFLDKYAHNIVPSTKQGEQGQTEKLTVQGSRLTTNIRNRQRRQQNNAAEELTGHIDSDYLEDNSIIVVKTGGSIVKDLNGLVANQVKSKYERPVLVLNEDNGKLSGSGRGFESPVMDDFREFIRNSGFAEYAEGQ